MRAGGCCKVANKYSGSFAPSRWSPPVLKHGIEYGLVGNLTQCVPRASPMRTASGYQAPAVPYHTLICGSFSTPNTALVRKNAEYITNTRICARAQRAGKYTEMWGHFPALRGRICASPPHPHGSAGRFTPIGRMRKGGCAAGLPVCFYREDAKGRAAKSVRDRFTALLRSGLSDARRVTAKHRGAS